MSMKGQKAPLSSWNDSLVIVEKVHESIPSVEKVHYTPRRISGTAVLKNRWAKHNGGEVFISR